MKQKIVNERTQQSSRGWLLIVSPLLIVAIGIATIWLRNSLTPMTYEGTVTDVGTVSVIAHGDHSWVSLLIFLVGLTLMFSVMAISTFCCIGRVSTKVFGALFVVVTILICSMPIYFAATDPEQDSPQSAVATAICETSMPGSKADRALYGFTTCSLQNVDDETNEPVREKVTFEFEPSENVEGLKENEQQWNYYRVVEGA